MIILNPGTHHFDPTISTHPSLIVYGDYFGPSAAVASIGNDPAAILVD